jgi:hypothetical protein
MRSMKWWLHCTQQLKTRNNVETAILMIQVFQDVMGTITPTEKLSYTNDLNLQKHHSQNLKSHKRNRSFLKQ